MSSVFQIPGSFIDDRLNFKYHIKIIANKISSSIGILSNLRCLFPASTLLYYSLINPHLLFGLAVWRSTFPIYIHTPKLQNKSIRIITNSIHFVN